MKYCLTYIPHRYVYRKYLYLSAGVQYIFHTADLDGDHPDTYMYLVRGTQIVAKNDDYIGLASQIAYVPSVSAWYILIIRGYGKYSYGTCDVWQSVANQSPSKIANNVKFGGYPVWARWRSDERIFTKNAWGDTYLYLICGSTMLRNDDGGDGLCSSITPGFSGTGLVVVGSFSPSSQGRTNLCNYYMSYLHNPREEDEMDDPQIIISDDMAKFQAELIKEKPSLEELPYAEQVSRVTELRDSILGKEDLNRLVAPEERVPDEFTAAFKQYQEILRASQKGLEALPPDRRAAEMAKIEFEKRRIFGNLVPQEEL